MNTSTAPLLSIKYQPWRLKAHTYRWPWPKGVDLLYRFLGTTYIKGDYLFYSMNDQRGVVRTEIGLRHPIITKPFYKGSFNHQTVSLSIGYVQHYVKSDDWLRYFSRHTISAGITMHFAD